MNKHDIKKIITISVVKMYEIFMVTTQPYFAKYSIWTVSYTHLSANIHHKIITQTFKVFIMNSFLLITWVLKNQKKNRN